ncbi:MAG: ribonuclease HII [Lachnospiraceae bacterium]|nr:ribonuclease HII [Lachnospiraceae bacterium]
MKSITDIKNEYRSCTLSTLHDFIKAYGEDERSGVKAVVKSAQKQLSDYEAELKRTEEMKRYEKQYAQYEYICGIDEVGRGPLAGPVVACAVILKKDCDILYINDSKKLSAKKREELYDKIMAEAVAVGLGCVSNERIDEINILNATYEAMRQAIQNLPVKPDILLNDAVTIPGVDIKQIPIIKGDAKSISIAAASIVAKVTRDRMMVEYDSVYPGYGFASNKGYGSEEHMQAIKRLSITPIHRKTFIPEDCLRLED